MAKKFGKFLLATAAIGTAAAAAYYFFSKKESDATEAQEDEDYDDFSEDLDEEDTSRTYVALNRAAGETAEDASTETDDFTPLTEQVNQQAQETLEETSEAFFDEDEEEPADI